ncbi:Alpha/Beta hydrolase protein [Rhodocollybia butyracea]|uniref:Alpha/Beta hydrolase protein n=1 Tax=Rhodocollybia butyracea TaxID=206335 RepID=A0A9P5PI76_9AGAR|nr:Alpha/Beta hydrolase protein [Rhodocollybia butyracea]
MFTTDQIVVDHSSNVWASRSNSSSDSKPSSSYETIILVHGNSFSNAIFKHLLPLKNEFNLRIVALNRRGFAGSTQFFTWDEEALAAISEETKSEFHALRGVEILRFIDGFIQHECCDGKSIGGIMLVGWSLGSTFSLAAIANVDSSLLSDETRDRLASYLRAHVLLEPALTSLGLPAPPDSWLSYRDPNIPTAARGRLFVNLVTAYYDYSDEILASRDSTAAIGVIVPSISRVPSIYSFSQAEYDEIVTLTPDSSVDLYYSKVLHRSVRQAYLKACYDTKLRSALKHMKTWEVAGSRSWAFVWPTYWEIQDDDAKAGEGEKEKFIRFMIMEGVNHFMHWDEPVQTMKTFKEILNS